MKKIYFLLFCISSLQTFAQGLVHPFYSNFNYGGNTEMTKRNMLQINTSFNGNLNSTDLLVLRKSKEEKWTFGLLMNHIGTQGNFVNTGGDQYHAMARRTLLTIGERKLYGGVSVGHYFMYNFERYKYYGAFGSTSNLNYAGKILEVGFTFNYSRSYHKAPNNETVWYNSNSSFSYLGLKNKIKNSILRTRISGSYFQTNTIGFLSQQLYLASKWNFGYLAGTNQGFQLNLGKTFNRLDLNIGAFVQSKQFGAFGGAIVHL